MKKFNFDKNSVIFDYLQGNTLICLGKKYSCDTRSIKKILVNDNVFISPQKRNINQEEINGILLDYKNRVTGGEIAKKYSIGREKVMEILKKNNAPYHSNHKYDFNRRFFKNINSEKKAYWLGFLYADGSVYKSKDNISNHLIIKLSSKDINHLEKFKKDFNLPHPIKIRKENGFGGGFESATIRITSKELVNDLIRHGCVPNKTFILQFPKIKEKLYSHFIRGYFDGDGSISVTQNRGQFTLLGNYDFLSDVQKILIKYCNLYKTKIAKKNKIYYLRYGGNNCLRRIGVYLYDEHSACLERKHNLFKILLFPKLDSNQCCDIQSVDS